MTTAVQSAASALPPVPVRRFTVVEYRRMIDSGILTEDDAVELLEGWIVPKIPHNPPHDATLIVAQDALRANLPAGWHIRPQCAATTVDSEPEPDLAVVAGQARDYLHRLPGPADIAIVIEISDSTLHRDREIKGRLYARAGIATYWIINLVDMQVEVYSDPTGPVEQPEYRQRRSCLPNESIPLLLAGKQVGVIAARDLLPA